MIVSIIVCCVFVLFVIFIILFIVLKSTKDEIQKDYPHAYEEYVSANQLDFASYHYVISLVKISKRNKKEWIEQENAIKEEQARQKEEQAKQYYQCLQEEVKIIQQQYPLAYHDFISRNIFPENPIEIGHLERIAQRSTAVWSKEENEIRKRKEIKQREKAAEEERKRKEREEQERKIAEEKRRKEKEERIRKEQEDVERVKAKREQSLNLIVPNLTRNIDLNLSTIQHQKTTSITYKTDKDKILNELRLNGIDCFYHFTSVENISSIKNNGGLYSWWSIKQNNIQAPFIGGAGEDSPSHILDIRYGLQDYVRLSFCDDHPMAYRHKMNGVQLVLQKIDIEVAIWKDTLFSDRNAADSGHHHGGTIDDLRKVDYDAVKQHYVRRDDPHFKPHQAEVMVKTFVPLKYIKNIDSPLSM